MEPFPVYIDANHDAAPATTTSAHGVFDGAAPSFAFLSSAFVPPV